MELQTLKGTMGLILSEKKTPGTQLSTTVLTAELHTFLLASQSYILNLSPFDKCAKCCIPNRGQALIKIADTFPESPLPSAMDSTALISRFSGTTKTESLDGLYS